MRWESLMAITASTEEQQLLLDVQAVDTKILQAGHKRNNVPEIATVQELEVALGSLDMKIVAVSTEVSDLSVVQEKAEADVEVVRSRAARDKERLDGGSITNSKELESLQSEIESLSRRQATLEDEELEVMQQLESAQNALDAFNTEREPLAAALEAAIASRDSQIAECNAEIDKLTAQRNDMVSDLPADLVKLYDKVRDDLGGVGAALLTRGACQGCRIALDSSEIQRIRNLGADVVVRCEECQRILVRTAESGL